MDDVDYDSFINALDLLIGATVCELEDVAEIAVWLRRHADSIEKVPLDWASS